MIHISECLAAALDSPAQDLVFDASTLESPIELEFARVLKAWIRPPDRWGNQVSVATAWATFRLDFLFESRMGVKIAFECDGQDFHSTFRDRCRDALILWSHKADVVVRIAGTDIHAAASEAFAAVVLGRSELFPEKMAAPIRRRFGHHFEILSTGEEFVSARVQDGRWGRYLRPTLRSRSAWCGSSSWMKDFHGFAWSRRGEPFNELVDRYMGERVAHGGI